MVDRKIYVVFYGDYEHVHDIEAVFDSKEQVIAFKRRFLRNQQLKVMEFPLNPAFISDKERIPYLISFGDYSSKPVEVITLFGIEDCEFAAQEVVKRSEGMVSFYLFAKNKKAAIAAALVKRDGLVMV